MTTPPLPRSLFSVIGSYHSHAGCKGCQEAARKAAVIAGVAAALRGSYGDGAHSARIIRVFLPQPIPMPEPATPKGV